MAKQKKNTKGQQWLLLVLAGIMGGCFGVLLKRCIVETETLGDATLRNLVLVLSTVTSLIFHIVAHEGGHLVFGLLSGYEFCSFRVFNFILVMNQGKLQLRRLSVAGTAGQCLMAPPEPVDGKIPVVLYNLGGAILNVFFGSVFLGLYFALERYPLVAVAMLMAAMIGFFLGITNAMPMMTAFIPNDGYNAVSLKKHPQAMRAFWIQLKIVEQISQGIRLKDMPAEWFRVPDYQAMQNGTISALGVYACNRLMDENRLEEARTQIEQLLAADICLAGLHRYLLTNELIFIETVGQNRPEVIRPMLSKEMLGFQKKMSTSPSVLRTQYACALLVDRNTQKAAQIKAKLDKVMKKYPYPSDLEQEYVFLQMIEQKASCIS